MKKNFKQGGWIAFLAGLWMSAGCASVQTHTTYANVVGGSGSSWQLTLEGKDEKDPATGREWLYTVDCPRALPLKAGGDSGAVVDSNGKIVMLTHDGDPWVDLRKCSGSRRPR